MWPRHQIEKEVCSHSTLPFAVFRIRQLSLCTDRSSPPMLSSPPSLSLSQHVLRKSWNQGARGVWCGKQAMAPQRTDCILSGAAQAKFEGITHEIPFRCRVKLTRPRGHREGARTKPLPTSKIILRSIDHWAKPYFFWGEHRIHRGGARGSNRTQNS